MRYSAKQRNLFIFIFLALTTFVVFYQVIDYDFTIYDDPEYITDNVYVIRGISLDNFIWAFSSFHAANWHPLTWLSHMTDIQIFGLNPAGHHFVNLMLHILNTLLIFLFLERATGAFWQSSVVAAFFALHPLHVESVAWISERKDVLSTLFWFLTLILYQRYIQRPIVSRYLLCLLCFVLGLMAKPMLVTVPFMLLLLDYWPLGRLSIGSAQSSTTSNKFEPLQYRSFSNLLLEKMPFFILSAVSCIITIIAQREGGAVESIRSVPLLFRMGNALIAYATYIGKMIWPSDLAAIYLLPPNITVKEILGSFFLLSAISVFVTWKSKRHPYLMVGWLWYLGTLVPVIGLVQVGMQSMADRYTYVPLVGLFIMIVWGVSSLLEKLPYRRIILIATTGLLLLALALCTRKQLEHWRNSIFLFEQAIEINSDNHVAHKNLALSLAKVGRFTEAYEHAQKALRIVPEESDAMTVMGLIYAMEGRTLEAAFHFEKAIKIETSNDSAHYNLAVALVKLGKLEEAIQHYNEVLRLKPDKVEARVDLASALLQLGRTDEAIQNLNKAVQQFPESLEARYTLAICYAESGRIDEAIEHFTYLVERYNMPEALHGLGISLIRKGKIEEAIGYLSRAMQMRPDVAEFKRSYESAVRLKAKASRQ